MLKRSQVVDRRRKIWIAKELNEHCTVTLDDNLPPKRPDWTRIDIVMQFKQPSEQAKERKRRRMSELKKRRRENMPDAQGNKWSKANEVRQENRRSSAHRTGIGKNQGDEISEEKMEDGRDQQQ